MEYIVAIILFLIAAIALYALFGWIKRIHTPICEDCKIKAIFIEQQDWGHYMCPKCKGYNLKYPKYYK